jgi:hypothetical protein
MKSLCLCALLPSKSVSGPFVGLAGSMFHFWCPVPVQVRTNKRPHRETYPSPDQQTKQSVKSPRDEECDVMEMQARGVKFGPWSFRRDEILSKERCPQPHSCVHIHKKIYNPPL